MEDTEDLIKLIIENMKHMEKISIYLQTENEVEFFKQASVLFEQWIEKYYKGDKVKPSHWEKRSWLFKQLSELGVPWAKDVKNFIRILSEYRNTIMHNLEPNINREELRNKLIKELRQVYGSILGLKEGVSTDKRTLQRQMIDFGKNHKEVFSRNTLNEINNNLPPLADQEINTYDLHLYQMILHVYQLLESTRIGIRHAQRST